VVSPLAACGETQGGSSCRAMAASFISDQFGLVR
jgi:hypothetical protein